MLLDFTPEHDRTVAFFNRISRLVSLTDYECTTLYLLTNLPPEAAPATVVARVYRGRWRLETAFQILATALTSEIDTLAYPKAAESVLESRQRTRASVKYSMRTLGNGSICLCNP